MNLTDTGAGNSLELGDRVHCASAYTIVKYFPPASHVNPNSRLRTKWVHSWDELQSFKLIDVDQQHGCQNENDERKDDAARAAGTHVS